MRKFLEGSYWHLHISQFANKLMNYKKDSCFRNSHYMWHIKYYMMSIQKNLNSIPQNRQYMWLSQCKQYNWRELKYKADIKYHQNLQLFPLSILNMYQKNCIKYNLISNMKCKYYSPTKFPLCTNHKLCNLLHMLNNLLLNKLHNGYYLVNRNPEQHLSLQRHHYNLHIQMHKVNMRLELPDKTQLRKFNKFELNYM